jgi:hypothetical protein
MIIICTAWEIEELLPEIEQVYQDELIDKTSYPSEKMIPMITSKEINTYVLPGLSKFETEIGETSWWKNMIFEFDSPANYQWEIDKHIDDTVPEEKVLPKLYNNDGLPFVIGSKKIGRNDPCPCGSGKKYKKCCGKVI